MHLSKRNGNNHIETLVCNSKYLTIENMAVLHLEGNILYRYIQLNYLDCSILYHHQPIQEKNPVLKLNNTYWVHTPE